MHSFIFLKKWLWNWKGAFANTKKCESQNVGAAVRGEQKGGIQAEKKGKEVKAGHGLEKTVVTDTIRLFRDWFSTIIWFYNTQLLKSTIITIKGAVDSTDANSWIWFSPTEHANAFCSQPTVISQFFHRQMHRMSLLCTRGNHQASEQITAAYISLFKEKYIHVGGAHLPFPGHGNVWRHKIMP